MKILDGRKIADNIISDLTHKTIKLSSKPGLAIVLIGDDTGSQIYVDLKEKAAKEVGITIKKHLLKYDVTEGEVIKIIDDLNKDENINGILVQFPLPKGLDKNKIIKVIDPNKDVDGFHPKNIEALIKGQDCIVPGLAEGIVKLIDETKIDLNNKKAVIVANSDVFSQPLEYLLKQKKLEVIITNPNENDFNNKLVEADIVIVAIGQPNYIKGDMIKEGTIIIDVGYNRVDDKAVGDVDFESVKDKVSWITPVPGGVGPMTVAMLLNNVYKAYAKQKSLDI
ncbi:MAG: bifunctional 5,10-methylenetetrahydrofolate dehydrogenase/5,10-methenyltetrahydrofolate cyclohydrolase [bacterium]|nr:bifunctional 5,10-methylenetetrahydrofolate dehydrogenase/5,10-methenyltetrahydrofolate cyclohydrolase [bacterium]